MTPSHTLRRGLGPDCARTNPFLDKRRYLTADPTLFLSVNDYITTEPPPGLPNEGAAAVVSYEVLVGDLGWHGLFPHQHSAGIQNIVVPHHAAP